MHRRNNVIWWIEGLDLPKFSVEIFKNRPFRIVPKASPFSIFKLLVIYKIIHILCSLFYRTQKFRIIPSGYFQNYKPFSRSFQEFLLIFPFPVVFSRSTFHFQEFPGVAVVHPARHGKNETRTVSNRLYRFISSVGVLLILKFQNASKVCLQLWYHFYLTVAMVVHLLQNSTTIWLYSTKIW